MAEPQPLPPWCKALDWERALARLLRLVDSRVRVEAMGLDTRSSGTRVTTFGTLTRADGLSRLIDAGSEILRLRLQPGGTGLILNASEFEHAVVMAAGEDDLDQGVLLRFSSGLAVTVALDPPLDDPIPGD